MNKMPLVGFVSINDDKVMSHENVALHWKIASVPNLQMNFMIFLKTSMEQREKDL